MSARPSTPLNELDPLRAPSWVAAALGPDAGDVEPYEKEGVLVDTRTGAGLLWICARVPQASRLDDRGFQTAVARAYVAVFELVRGAELYPVRLWNFIPDIRRASDDGFSRYEVFNAGRQEGVRHLDAGDPCAQPITASGVGHGGTDFVIQVLAARIPAHPVENPRQCPSYHYSVRYGPQPPLFSRASRVDEPLGALPWRRIGLVSGTASIVGEDSTHEGDLAGQLEESFLNLATVAGEVTGRPIGLAPDAASVARALEVYEEVCVYVLRESDEERIRDAFSRSLPQVSHLDLVSAQLCRPELLVETEGILHWEP